jgi:hypothetical protein
VKRPLTAHERRNWLRSWRSSLFLHAVVYIFLLIQTLWFPFPQLHTGSEHTFIAHWQSEEPVELILEAEIHTAEELASLENIPFEQLNLHDSRWQTILQEPLEEPAERPAESLLVTEQLQQWIDRSNQRTPDENLNQLSELGEKLQTSSSSQGVEEVSGTLNRLLGSKSRATEPIANAPAGDFDYSSGQLHDVRKIENPDGSVAYMAIMLDAAGRTTELPLTGSEAEQAYRTMQLVKSNPLLERVYRSVVMGIIDKMLQPK